MKKLYIPTSSMNFNNILSTESISPKSIYENRYFGYKQFSLVEANPFNNYLVAYDKLPVFHTDNSEYDNYPLVIEFSESLLPSNTKKKKINNITIYLIQKTIYLHPSKTRLLFFKEQDRKISFIKAEPSIETKMLPFYSKKIITINPNSFKDNFNWKKSILSKIDDRLNKNKMLSEIEYDTTLNKIKGFYYLYFIGILLSNKINSKSILNEIKKAIEQNEINKIIGLLESLKIKIDKNIEVSKDAVISAVFIDRSYINDIDKLISFLKRTKPGKWDFYSQLEWMLFEINKIIPNLFFLIDDFINYLKEKNQIKSILVRKYTRIKNNMSNENLTVSKSNPIITIKKINLNNSKITQFDDDFFSNVKQKELYRNLINEIIKYQINNKQEFKREKLNLAYQIGIILKEYIPNWNTSEERDYFNSLMDNIENFQPFDVKSISSLILQSIAIFIQKGEDINKLIESLRKNSISDFRVALGLWGSIFGFSAIPKNILNSLLTTKNIESTREFYNIVYNNIHNQSLKIGNFQLLEDIKTNTEHNNSNKISTKPKENKKIVKSISNTSIIEIVPKCPECGADMVLRDGIKGKFYGCSNYPSTGCKGTRNYPYSISKSNKSDIEKYLKLILEYVNEKRSCKISDMINDLKKKGYPFNVGQTKKIIEEHLKSNLIVFKEKNSNAVKLKEKDLFNQ